MRVCEMGIHDIETTLSIVKFIILLCKDMGGPQKRFVSFLDEMILLQ